MTYHCLPIGNKKVVLVASMLCLPGKDCPKTIVFAWVNQSLSGQVNQKISSNLTSTPGGRFLPALPETNGSHLKMDGWNTSFLLGRLGLFSVAFAVSYKEVDMWHFHTFPPTIYIYIYLVRETSTQCE